MKEIRAVEVAQSGTDTLEHETVGANLVDSHMLFSQGHLTVNLQVDVARLFLDSLSISHPSHVRNQNKGLFSFFHLTWFRVDRKHLSVLQN